MSPYQTQYASWTAYTIFWKPTEYARQLREKQKAKRIYNVTERQLASYDNRREKFYPRIQESMRKEKCLMQVSIHTLQNTKQYFPFVVIFRQISKMFHIANSTIIPLPYFLHHFHTQDIAGAFTDKGGQVNRNRRRCSLRFFPFTDSARFFPVITHIYNK